MALSHSPLVSVQASMDPFQAGEDASNLPAEILPLQQTKIQTEAGIATGLTTEADVSSVVHTAADISLPPPEETLTPLGSPAPEDRTLPPSPDEPTPAPYTRQDKGKQREETPVDYSEDGFQFDGEDIGLPFPLPPLRADMSLEEMVAWPWPVGKSPMEQMLREERRRAKAEDSRKKDDTRAGPSSAGKSEHVEPQKSERERNRKIRRQRRLQLERKIAQEIRYHDERMASMDEEIQMLEHEIEMCHSVMSVDPMAELMHGGLGGMGGLESFMGMPSMESTPGMPSSSAGPSKHSMMDGMSGLGGMDLGSMGMVLDGMGLGGTGLGGMGLHKEDEAPSPRASPSDHVEPKGRERDRETKRQRLERDTAQEREHRNRHERVEGGSSGGVDDELQMLKRQVEMRRMMAMDPMAELGMHGLGEMGGGLGSSMGMPSMGSTPGMSSAGPSKHNMMDPMLGMGGLGGMGLGGMGLGGMGLGGTGGMSLGGMGMGLGGGLDDLIQRNEAVRRFAREAGIELPTFDEDRLKARQAGKRASKQSRRRTPQEPASGQNGGPAGDSVSQAQLNKLHAAINQETKGPAEDADKTPQQRSKYLPEAPVNMEMPGREEVIPV